MASEVFSMGDYLIIMFGGFFESVGAIATIYASSTGNAGIAFAIANTCCIYVTIFNYFAMGQ